MGGCVSARRKWIAAGRTGVIWEEERSGQGMTEQSKNRRRQDKVIKDGTAEGEAGEEDRRGHESRGLRQDWTGRGGREQDWVIIMVMESGSERRAAEPRWLTQMHFQWNMECHTVPEGEDYQSKVRKYTQHFICLWFSFRPTALVDSRKRSGLQPSDETLELIFYGI